MGEDLGNFLAPVNATLNLASALFLAAGYLFIKRKAAHRHRWAMTAALTASALFLLSYLLRISLTGTHRIAAEGTARLVYLGILFSHIILAAAIVPLVLRLLYLVRGYRYHAHAHMARWVFPLWMYVSLTGLLVYVLLYHVYGYA